MAPQIFVDAAGIPRVVSPQSALQTLQGIAGNFANAIDPAGPLTSDLDLGSAVKNNKVNNIKQIRQFETQLPTPYDIRAQRQVSGSRAPYVPAPRQGLPLNLDTPAPKSGSITIPSGGQKVTPVTGFGGSNPIVGNTSKVGPVQGPQQVQGPSPRSPHGVRINPAQGPRPATVMPKKGMFGGRMAGGLWSQAAMLLADPIIRNLPDNPYSRTYTAQQDAAAAGKPVPKGLFTDQVDNATQSVLNFFTGGDNKTTTEPVKPTEPPKTKQPPKSVVENPNDSWDDPIAGKGPKGNEVGSDAAPNTPGLQGPGDPAAPAPAPNSPGNPYEKGTQDHGMYIWAQKYKGLAENVKPGQAGYDAIQVALGKKPQNPYEGGADYKLGDKDVSEVYKPTIDLKSDIAPITDDFKVGYDTAPEGYSAGNSDLLYASASAFQQPNFDGSSSRLVEIPQKNRSLYRISPMQTQILQKLCR